MINTKELRIGNYCLKRDASRDLSFSKVESSDFGDPGNMEPVPISEYWLEQLGFEYFPEWGDDLDQPYEWLDLKLTDDVYIRKHFDAEDYIIIKYQYLVMCIDLRYLHQLQNLYFALTGKELTINPEIS